MNLPAVRLRASRRGGGTYVWDGVRGCWLLLTPEEWVRRHVIGYLTDELGIPAVHIAQEYPVGLEGMAQRADIVVMDSLGKPLMLVECKSTEVRIDGAVLDQAVRYNSVVGARYVMLTNGLTHYFYATYDGVHYLPLDSVPNFEV